MSDCDTIPAAQLRLRLVRSVCEGRAFHLMPDWRDDEGERRGDVR